jgi:membrane protein DedA with SNARE-associated domain
MPTSHTSNDSQKRRKKFPKQQSHTTPVSLVLSLIIGILFFGTVVFLIGRRWGEQCFRRGYSRVDYLLNDYD